MKKNLLSAALSAAVLTLAAGTAQAATLTAGTYDVSILADGVSCFTFGNCSVAAAGANSYFTNNNNDLAAAAASANPSFGSADITDPNAGRLQITVAADRTFTIDTYKMDTYIGTAGGMFATAGVNGATGSISSNGLINFDLKGRSGVAQFFGGSLGIQPWNVGSTFTTGSQSNIDPSTNLTNLTLTGMNLANNGTAKAVSVSNVGPAWGFFNGTPYTEVFSMKFTPTSAGAGIVPSVPVPAAIWLFGSGLLGLVGVARRKKSA